MIYFDNEFGTVRWDDLSGAVWHSWKQFADGNDFRTVVNAGVDLLILKKTHRWLGDLRNLGPVTQEDQTWSYEVWMRRATEEGMTHLALVSPRKVVAQMAVKSFLSKIYGRDLVTNNFDDVEKARLWLRAQK